MKKYFYLATLLLFLGCADYIGGDINADPNSPNNVPVASQFPSIQISLADSYAGIYSRLTSMLTQQVEGVARGCTAFYQYTGLTPDRFVTLWENLYGSVLNEIQIAKSNASEQKLNHHLGALNIMEAFTLMIITDVWDDIPYSSAFQGIDNNEPTYDKQELIYQQVFDLLDDGIALLNASPGAITLGSEDVFLNGNTDLWIKTAYAIKARGLMHFDRYDEALAAAQKSFESSTENFGYQYTGEDAAFNWYRFNRDRTGDIEFNPYMRTLMQNKQDLDRLGVYDQIFDTNNTFINADHYFELISYREVQFIIAEVNVRNGNGGTGEGYTAFLNGIESSFGKLDLTETTFQSYLNNETFPQEGLLTIEEVILEKYIALFLQPEVYSDFRRTGYPALTPVSGSAIPVRFHYSANEYEYNSNTPLENEVNIFTDRVGWNQ